MFSNTELQEIRNSVDIVDVVSSYLNLTAHGKNYFGVCPFHDDHSPSMCVSKEKQIYTCFVCGATGNVFQFIKEYENISFTEAVKKVALIGGIEVKIDEMKPLKKESNLYDIYNLTNKIYQLNLNTTMGISAKEYLKKRGIDDTIIKEFGIGLSLTKGNIYEALIKKGFDNKDIIKKLNRHHDKDLVFKNINLLKEYFDNINIDLMYAFPNETMEDLKCDLDFFKSLDVEHISIYSLIIEENTKLYIDGIKPISEELDREMYYYIIDYLENIGYKHYEISNFSKEGLESRHNLNYWNNLNYYGFGLGASGYIKNTRYTNTRGINSYLKGNYKIYEEELDKNKMMEEELICGLRKMKGINEKTFKEKFGIDIRDVFNIDDLINKGLLIEEDNYIYIPKDKLYVSNNILLNFILD